MSTQLVPHDHGEEVALFRSQIIGALAKREMSHGQLGQALRELSQQRFRPPGSDRTRTFSVPTLERWLYAYKKGGLKALVPRPRSDRGHGQKLNPEQRALLCDIRREHPQASAALIRRTVVLPSKSYSEGVSAATLHNLGLVYQRTDRPSEARQYWNRSRAIIQELAQAHPSSPAFQEGLADVDANKLDEAVIPVLSLGATRRFLIRPEAGGPSTTIVTHGGDLVVMGGRCQRTWEPAVPKSARVTGPRISVQFRPRGVR